MDTQSDGNYYLSNGDGYKLYSRRWKPKGNPRAVVFVSHGFAEHSQYYETLARFLVEIGCLVCAHDHVGHGQSEGPRVQIDDTSTYVRDVFQHADLVKDQYPDLPFYYFGHSMGSAIGIKATLKSPNYFKGVILMGAPVKLANKYVTPFTSTLCQMVGWIFPNLPAFPLDYSLPTRDTDITERRIKDPLSYHGFSKTGWSRAMLRAVKEIEDNLEDIRIPLLILHGENDKICSVEGSKLLFEKCLSTEKTLKTYPNAYHNLLDEPEGIKEQALEDIVLWLKDRLN